MREQRKRPKGWRSLTVGELDLWWTVGEPKVKALLPGPRNTAPAQEIMVTLAVERADGSGKKLVATVRGLRALAVPSAGFRDVQTLAIEPASVRRLVEQAAPRGTWPTGTGTWRGELDLPDRPLPVDLAFRPEHLDGLTVLWKK